MIHELLDIEQLSSPQGQLVSDLAKLAVAGVTIVPTAILPVECFHDWRDRAFVNDA
jgi:hypothetical protein